MARGLVKGRIRREELTGVTAFATIGDADMLCGKKG